MRQASTPRRQYKEINDKKILTSVETFDKMSFVANI